MLTNTYSIYIQALCTSESLTGCSQTYEKVLDDDAVLYMCENIVTSQKQLRKPA